MESWPAPDVPRLPQDGARPALRLHDSSSRQLVGITPDRVARLYVCGITPYDATHLGHAATYLAFDTLVRVWLDQGLDVQYVQNVTDIDDPLLERAARDGEDWREVARRETALFRDDMTALRVVPPTAYVGAVEAMDGIAELVVRLRDAGAAYEVDGDLYFPVGVADGFGGVSGLDRAAMTALSAQRGGDPDRPGKKDPLDALLWLAERPGEPAWDSPLGRGRPGWHVECAAIALRHLSAEGRPAPVMDVQGGGSDLLFPHHEHSAVEAETATGLRPFATAYVHAGMIALHGEKMSKSLGNLVFVSRLRQDGVDPAAVRLALLAGHYRQDRDWHANALDEAARRLAAWGSAVARPAGAPAGPLLTRLRRALSEDLDTPSALAAVDAWCEERGSDGDAPGVVRSAVDALLGVRLPAVA